MTTNWVRGRRSALPFSVLLGSIAAALAAMNEKYAFAVFSLVLLSAFGAYLGYSGSEWAVVQGADADERQQSINLEAMRWSYYAVVLVAVGGFFVEVATGDPGAFTLVASVGGFTHMVSIAVLRRRR